MEKYVTTKKRKPSSPSESSNVLSTESVIDLESHLEQCQPSSTSSLPTMTNECNPKRTFSKVWNYFKKSSDKKYAKCLCCGKEYKTSGNTSNLKDHLKRFHTDCIKQCDFEVEDNPQSTLSSDEASSSSRTRNMRAINSYFSRLEYYESNSSKKKQIDNALAWMIALDFQPFSIVENKGFRNFVSILNPRYVLPSKHTIKTYIKCQYEESNAKLKKIVSDAGYVAITCDLWTSCCNESYLSVTCHLTIKFELKAAVLSTRKLLDATNHRSENIADSLKEIFLEWNIVNKIVCIVTDNASSMIKACEILSIRNMPCYAHTLNLVVQDALKCDEISHIIGKCKEIVSFFKSSTISMEKFKNEQLQSSGKALTLIQEVCTRWNSTFFMIKRILETNDAIFKTLLTTPRSPTPLTADEILILKDLEKLLSHFDEITQKLSGVNYVTVSLIVPITFGVHEKLLNLENNLETSEGKLICANLLQGVRTRLFAYERRSVPRIATLLDPRFKKEGFRMSTNAEEASKLLESEMLLKLKSTDMTTLNEYPENSDSSQPKDSLFNFLEQRMATKVKNRTADAIIIKRQYLERALSPQDSDPLLFWKLSSNDLQPLPQCAVKFLPVPATSVDSERVFSLTGQIITDRRNRINHKYVDILVFLNKNKWLLD